MKTSLLILVGLLAVGFQASQAQIIGGACNVLLGGCPTGALCLLGICVLQGGQTCGNLLTCPVGLVCVGTICVLGGAGQGDPILRGFDGREWEFLGKPGNSYALYSDNAHALNMRLFLGQMHDHNGTYIGGMGFQTRNHQFAVDLHEDGNLTLSMDGSETFIGSAAVEGYRKFGALTDSVTVEYASYMPDYGRAVVFTTDTLEVRVWAVPPGLVDEGGKPQPAYLNFRSALLASPVGDNAQGLIGETLKQVKPAAESSGGLTFDAEDRTFHGQGPEEDYLVKDVFDTDFKFNMFGQGKGVTSSRRRALSSAFSDVQFPLTACNGHC